MQRVKFSLLCLLALSFAGILAAQTAVEPNSDVGTASLQDFSGGAALNGTYFDVRHMSGDGVGYKNGYSQIGLFTPFWLSEDGFIAPNARLLLTDNSDIGVNAGLVARRYDSGRDRIWGINGYYDSDVSQYGNRYNQFGLGVETLGQFFDFRANGYVPTGEDKTIIGPVGLSADPFFFENRIGFIGTQLMEQALQGGDFEIGVPVSSQTPWFRAYAGGYAYQQDGGEDPVGVRARLEAWISNDLSVGVNTTWDEQFGTNVNFVADWRFAGFLPTRYFPQWTTRERMLMPVQRHWRTTVGHYEEEVRVLAYNPRDDQPYFVVWYDNSAAGLNDGTFENPYNTTLTHAIPNETDLVLVRRGNTNEGPLGQLDGSIVLPDFARMLGEGRAHRFDAYADFGPFHVDVDGQVLPDPAFNDIANVNQYPFLTSGADIITLGDHNEVSAFVLEGAGGRGIFGNGVAGFHLNNLEVANNAGGGIRLEDASGLGPVTSNLGPDGLIASDIIDSGVISNINRNPNVVGWTIAEPDLGNNAAGGIHVDTTAPGLNLAITNVAMNADAGMQLFGIQLIADGGSLTTTLTDVETNGTAPAAGNTTAGIILAETGQDLIATLRNISSSDNTGDGLQITGTNGTIQTTILGPPSSVVSVFNGNGGSGIVYTHAGGTGTLDIFNIEANDNGVDGLGLFGSLVTVMNVNVHDSVLTGNIRDGIHVEEVTGATVNLLVDPTDLSGNGRDGLFFMVDGSSTLNADVLGTTLLATNLNDNVRNAIHGEVTDGSIVNLTLTDTTADGSGEDGFFFNVDDSELNVIALRSTFSNSGVGGVAGSGILGTITNAGLVTFDFTETPVSNNLDNGMFVTATGQSNFQGSFTDSPFDDNGNTTGGDGIRLDLDDSPNSSLDLLGTTTVNRNGNNGFELNATNGTVFTSTFEDTQIVDNGQFAGGDGVQANVDASTVTQIFNNVTITNTAGPGPQNNGYLFTVSNGGDLGATFTGGSLSDNLVSAVNGVVNGNGTAGDSAANVSLDGVTADNSGGIGVNLQVNNAGLLEFGAVNGTSISNSGLDGINVLVTGNAVVDETIANLELESATIDGNGTTGAGSGLFATVTAAGTLNVCLDTSSVSGNFEEGIDLFVANADSIARFGVEGSNIDGNGSEGLLAAISDSGTLHYRSIGSTYDNNGFTLGAGAGVSVTAVGDGAAPDTATALLLFSGDSFDSNDGDGLFFDAQAGATLTVSLDGVASTGNGGFGVNFNASGSDTKANLLMLPPNANTLTGNTSGPLNVSVGAVDQVVLAISGSFDNGAGDGIGLSIIGANNALVAIQGPGTIDGNGTVAGDHGIDIFMQNVNNGSILIDGLTSINDSFDDGIHIEMDAVLSGALEINGATAINNSGGDAIDITLVNGTVLDGAAALGLISIDTLTLTDDLATPLNGCLPDPVSVTLNTLGLVAEPFTINQMTIDNSGARGISVNATTGSVITAGTGEITDNFITNSQNGDGLVVTLNAASADGLLIDGNSSSDNSGNGFNFDFTNSPVDSLTVTNNTGGVSVLTGLDFVITGDTFAGGGSAGAFTIGNTSDPGIDITSFTFDLSTITPTILAPFINYDSNGGVPFTPFGFTDLITGLATVNGTPVPPYPATLVPQGSQLINLAFTDFNPGEQFQWDADLDPDLNVQGPVFGDELAGATINVNFTGGLFQTGVLQLTANPQESRFVATAGNIGGSGVANNGLDGVRFSLNGSTLSNLLMEGNQIESNGTTGTGHGVNFQTVVNSDITGAVILENTITGNAGDGFRMVNPNTTGTPIGLTFQDNTITTNTGAGIELQLNNAEIANVNIESLDTGNQISNNGSFGIHALGLNTSQINLTMGGAGAAPNTLDGNSNAGVAIDLQNTATGTFNVSNTTISGSLAGGDAAYAGEGLAIHLSNGATLPNVVIGDPALDNTTFSGNASHGLHILASDTAVMNATTIQHVQSLNNTGDGLNITRNGTANITNAVINLSTFQENADGIDISAQFFPNRDTYTISNNQIQTNNGRGVSFLAQSDAQIGALLTGNTIDDSGTDGVQIVTVLVSAGDAAQVDSLVGAGVWTNNIFSNSGRLNGAGGAGLEVTGVHNLNIGLLGALNGNQFINNAGDGIEVNAPNAVGGALDIINATITGNNTEGTGNGLAGIDINSFGGNTINVSNSTISNNLGDGFEIDNSGPLTAITLTDNQIQFNGRDGVEYMDSGAGSLNITGTSLAANQITNNGFRGVDILANGGTANSTVSINRTNILANGQEGVFVMLSSAANQSTAAFRDNLASAAASTAGAIGATPHLNFNLGNANGNVINNNGQVAGNIGGSGLVMRVGTTRGGDSFNVAGGFASVANGGVDANVANNIFTGNFGADVLFESFVSQAAPTATTGTWTDQNEAVRGTTADVFSVTSFQSDPLARLDLVFNNNNGQELDVTRQGASFNNDEAVFKSRTQNQDNGTDGGADDDGPFSTGTRVRNAQRLAARNVGPGGAQLQPQLTIFGASGNSDNFLFSGIGQSTFRAQGVGNAFPLTTLTGGFFLDTNPYTDAAADANGTPFGSPVGGPAGINTMPWGWSVLP